MSIRVKYGPPADAVAIPAYYGGLAGHDRWMGEYRQRQQGMERQMQMNAMRMAHDQMQEAERWRREQFDWDRRFKLFNTQDEARVRAARVAAAQNADNLQARQGVVPVMPGGRVGDQGIPGKTGWGEVMDW